MNKKILTILILTSGLFADFNYSLEFDGDDYIEILDENSLDITGEITLEAWVKLNDSGQGQFKTVISKGYGPTNNYRLAVDWYNKVDFGYYGANNAWNEWRTIAEVINLNVWTHIAVTHSEGYDPVFYVNGSMVTSENYYGISTSNMLVNDYSLYIGQHHDVVENSYPFYGLIDEVRIWSDSLTQEQIAANMNQSLNPSGYNLLMAYWQFNEGDGDLTYDATANGNNGTINGAAWNTDATGGSEDDDENDDDDDSIELLTNATEYGVGGSEQGYPINAWYHDVKHQSLYLASDLSNAGILSGSVITGIKFKVNQTPGRDLDSLRIAYNWTSNTEISSFDTTTTVVHGPTNYFMSEFLPNNWVQFDFTTPITWDGVNNLIIEYSHGFKSCVYPHSH